MSLNFERVVKDLIIEREKWKKIPGYNCFWSGPDNLVGFKITPNIENGRVWTKLTILDHYSGVPGIAHGGVAYSILDGLMGWLVMSHLGKVGLTTAVNVNYYGPLKVGNSYVLEAIPDNIGQLLDSKKISIIGRVYSEFDCSNILIEVRASFFLPNLKTAQKVLGVEISQLGKDMFLDE